MSLTRYAEKLPLVQEHPARWLKIDAALVQGCASCSWRLPVPHSDGTTHTNGGRHPSKPHIANSWNKSSSGERVGPSHAEKKLGAARGMVGKHGVGEVMGAAPPIGRRGVEEVVEREPAEFPSRREEKTEWRATSRPEKQRGTHTTEDANGRGLFERSGTCKYITSGYCHVDQRPLCQRAHPFQDLCAAAPQFSLSTASLTGFAATRGRIPCVCV